MAKQSARFRSEQGRREEEDKESMREYRRSKRYMGYEDYSPSGRAAIRTYNKEAEGKKDYDKPRRGEGYPQSRSATKAAQAAQRSTSSELRRETRGKVSNDSIGYDNLEDVNKHKWKGKIGG